MKKEHIGANGKKYEHIRSASSKLNCSIPKVRDMCSRGELVCIQAGGSWYIESASLYRGKRAAEEKRVKKEITLSKLRKNELEGIRRHSKSARRLFGLEIRLRRNS